jgi:membrane-bound lytic murein transglycosylase D
MAASVVPDDKEYVVLIPATGDQVENIRVKTALGSNTNFIKNDIGFPILKRVTPSLKDKTLPIFYEINGLAGIQAQEGDSPLSLSMKADLRLDKLMDYNDLGEKDRIVPGDVYYLEKKKRKAAVPFHTVANDQTLWKISQIYGIRMKFLMRWNRLEQIVKLQPGRVIYLQKRRPKDKPVEYINMPIEEQIQDQKTKNKKDKINKTTVLTPENSPVASKPINEPSTEPPTNTTGIDTGSRRVVVVEDDGKTSTNYPSNPPIKTNTESDTSPKETKPVGINQEKPQNARMKVVTHTVTPGQNYFAVARQYGVSPQDVFSWNNVDPTSPTPLKLGQKLKIFVVSDGSSPLPQPTPSPAQVVVDQPQASPTTTENPQYHTVVKGDTAYSISKKYGISIEKLKELNNLGGTGISLGQKLKLR